MNKQYTAFEVDSDFITNKKHIYYLVATYGKGYGCIIASYSIKTDRIILKDVSNYIPNETMLKDFVRISKERYKKAVESD